MVDLLVKMLQKASKFITKLTQPSHRFILLILVIIWLNVLNIFIFHHRHKTLGYLTSKISLFNPLSNYDGHAIPKKLVESLPVKFLLDDAGIVSDRRRIDIHSQNYDDLISKHSFEELVKLPFSDRCDAFFKNLYVLSDSNWVMDAPNRFKIDTEYEMSWDSYKNKYKDEYREKLAKSQSKDPKDVSGKDIHKAIAKVYDGLKEQARKDEREMQEHIAIGRIFNKCYVTRDSFRTKNKLEKLASSQARLMSKFSSSRFVPTSAERKLSPKRFPDCADLETRVYPWLSYDFPTYERFSGYQSRYPPNMLEFTEGDSSSRKRTRDSEPIPSKLTGNRPCWLNTFKNLLSGRGVVVPFYEGSLEMTVSLIRLLRALKNELPVQIISFGRIGEPQKKALISAARDPLRDLPPSFEKVSNVFEDLILVSEEFGLMQQELWFVDALAFFVPEAKEKWFDFPLAVLATFASSFEEVLLIDPMAGPLRNPEYFFSQSEYEQKGAYFYRSKPRHTRREKDADFFNKLSPSLIDAIVFDIPILSAHTLDLPFFSGVQEMQDPGIMAIDKEQHFAAINSLMQLSTFWPAKFRGDISQELWLGLLVAGDENFHFNKYYPAALGEKIEEKGKPLRVCGAHTGHLDPQASNEIAWITNGFRSCPLKAFDAKAEFDSKLKWKAFKDAEDLSNYYKSRLDVDVAVIPPFEGTHSFKLENDEKNPASSWTTEKGCQDMIFCASSEIGGTTKYGSNRQRGQVVKLESYERDMIAFYGDIWLGTASKKD